METNENLIQYIILSNSQVIRVQSCGSVFVNQIISQLPLYTGEIIHCNAKLNCSVDQCMNSISFIFTR